MADTLKLRGGNTADNAGFTGADREVTVDTEKKTLVVHDGTNAGGTPLMREEGNSGSQVSSVKFATSGTDAIAIDSNQRVGIGESTMDALLVIKGNSDASTTPSIRLKDGTDTREAWISNSAGDLILANGGDDNTPHCMIKMFDGNIIDFNTANSSAMVIDSNQQVGIGTSNPNAVLHCRKDVNTAYDPLQDDAQRTDTATINVENGNGSLNSFAQIVFDTAGSNQSIARIVAVRTGTNASNDLAFVTEEGNTKRESFRITGAGNCGIGPSIPDSLLHLAAETAKTNEVEHMLQLTHTSSGTTTTGFGTGIRFQGERNNGALQNIGEINFVADVNSGNNISSSLLFRPSVAGVPNTHMIIKSDGNVGIGTTDPSSAKLQIHGTGTNAQLLRLINTHDDTESVSSAQLKFGVTNSSGERNCRIEAVEHTGISHGIALDFYTNAANSTDGETRKMRIGADGKIFLSTNIDQTGNGNAGLFASGSQLQFFRGNQGDYIIFKTTADAIIGTIRNNNNTSTQYNTTGSDRALKKNFESWNENVLNLFKNINPQKFNFIHQNDGDDKTKGFVAQDMVGSFPEAYTKGEEDDAKYYFNPSGMVVYLMKAIQELSAKVEALEAA